MTVAALAAQQLRPGTDVGVGPTRIGSRTPRPTEGPAFGETLRTAVDRVDGAQKAADAQVEAFVSGETENTHEVMIALNQAELHFQLMTEVRNKLLDGYQELMRMQV